MSLFRLFVASVVFSEARSALAHSVINCDDSTCILQNGFVELVLSISGGAWVSSLKGDFQGRGKYGQNLLSEGGFRFEREDDSGVVHTSAGIGEKSLYSTFEGKCASLSIPAVYDDASYPYSSESWNFELCDGERSVTFVSQGSVLPAASSETAKAVRHSLYMTPISTVGFFDRGVVQMMSADSQRLYFGSSDVLNRCYVVGEAGSVDIQRAGATGGEQDITVMMSAAADVVNKINFRSGFQEVLVGTFEASQRDLWTAGWANQTGGTVLGSASWERIWTLTPNDRDFPCSTLPVHVSNMDNDGQGDLGAFMTGIYSNGVGNLCTFDNEVTLGMRVAQIATTLRVDDQRGYDGTYNYFDPDNFFALSAILYSGDSYLQKQVRDVIERTGKFMKQNTGQLPHHFNGAKPYFLALSGETQTGPNVFWVKTALQYVASSGDFDWLRSYMPTLRTASDFVFNLIETDAHLLYAPGSLMIDVFIRNNYTADSNAMVVGFLRDFAAAERKVGNSTRADELESLAMTVAAAMNDMLWADDEAGADHYITQLNKADGSTRDFVDYDANLIAVSHGIPDETRARAILKRVDGGRCSAASGAGAQFVSELYYGTDDTTNANTGDSWCSMARIGWFDAKSRKLLGSSDDLAYFDNSILEPIKDDLIRDTWMHERYGCDGQQQENRTMYYFEYPALVSMLLKDIRYGVQLDVSGVTISPFRAASTAFSFHMGSVDVDYSQESVVMSVPADSSSDTYCSTSYVIRGLRASAQYALTASVECACRAVLPSVTTTADGVAFFFAPAGVSPCKLSMLMI